MAANQQDTKAPPKSWEQTDYHRTPWVREKHGERVLPPNEQESNVKLSDAEVMGTDSTAPPIAGRHDTGHGPSDEPSGAK